MLPKKMRFSASDFSKLKIIRPNFKKLITKYGFFIVYNSSSSEPHLTSPINRGGIVRKKGIILSKKNFKTAVFRNKVKRLFYNTILEIQKEKPEIQEKSFVLHPKNLMTKEDLLEDLRKI